MADATAADVSWLSAVNGLQSSPNGLNIDDPLMQYHLSNSLEFNTAGPANLLSARSGEKV